MKKVISIDDGREVTVIIDELNYSTSQGSVHSCEDGTTVVSTYLNVHARSFVDGFEVTTESNLQEIIRNPK